MMPGVCITGGTVVDQAAAAGESASTTGRSSRSPPSLDTRGATKMLDRPDAWSLPGSSTSRSTSANRATRKPRRSRPAPAPRRSAGSPRIVAMPNTDPALDDAGWSRVLDAGGRGCATCARRAASRSAARASSSRRSASCPSSACACSPTTARRRGRRADAPRAGVRARPRRGPRPALREPGARRRAGTCTKASGRAGSGSRAARRGRGADGACATSSWPALTGAPVHVLHLSTAGRVELVRAAKADGLRVTAEATPTTSRSPTSCCAGYDPVFKVNPPLRTEADVDARAAPGSPTARSTPSPPTTRRTRPRRRSGRSRRRRRGCSDSRPRSASRARRARTCRSRDVVALLSWQPAAHRRRRRRATAARSWPGEPANLVRDRPRPRRGWSSRRGWRAGAATRPTPGAAHRPGPPHDPATASRSSSTGSAAMTNVRQDACT